MSNFAYIRCSSIKSDTENQRFEINNWIVTKGIVIDEWIEETVSGIKDPKKRKLGRILNTAKEGDTIICTEISRLGRSIYMVMDVLNYCMEHKITVVTIKDNFVLDSSISSAVLAFAFSLSATIERQLISQRTKEALARKKEMGVKLGRPKGAKSKNTKLSGKEPAIRILLEEGNSYAAIARMLHVDRSTLVRHVKSRMLDENGNLLPEDI